jgi:hypothetical protein
MSADLITLPSPVVQPEALALMPGVDLMALTKSDAAAHIADEHVAASVALRKSVAHGLRAGVFLIVVERRKLVPYRERQSFYRDECKLSPRSAQRYKQLVTRWLELPIELRHSMADLSLNDVMKALVGPSSSSTPKTKPVETRLEKLLETFARTYPADWKDRLLGLVAAFEGGAR